jgi:large subunit ribosomal protein L16
MLQPKRTKYRGTKGKMKGNSGRGHELSNGMFGIKSVHEDGMFLTSRQIEAARIAATRFMKREGQLWIKIFPDKPITKNLLRYVWVKVKVQLSIGLPLLNRNYV